MTFGRATSLYSTVENLIVILMVAKRPEDLLCGRPGRAE